MPESFTTLFFLFVLKDKDDFAGGLSTTACSTIINIMIIQALAILIFVLKIINSSVTISRKVMNITTLSPTNKI
jgi:cation:H+ antiporter